MSLQVLTLVLAFTSGAWWHIWSTASWWRANATTAARPHSTSAHSTARPHSNLAVCARLRPVDSRGVSCSTRIAPIADNGAVEGCIGVCEPLVHGIVGHSRWVQLVEDVEVQARHPARLQSRGQHDAAVAEQCGGDASESPPFF